MSSKVTMQDIADRLNITKVSVSKALNDKPGVSDALRKRIAETASQMGYAVLKDDGKKSFLFIVAKRFFLETDAFYNEIFYYLNEFCMDKGYQLTQVVLNQKSETNPEWPIHPEPFDGIFLAGELSDNYIKMLCEHPVPTVAVDFYKSFLDVDYVLIDNFYLGYRATNYLIGKGHKNIGFVGNVNQTSSINDRFFGYLKALQNNNLHHNNKWIISNNDPITGLYQIDISFPEPLPTAFVCHCDMAAYFLTNSLKSINKYVPQDISLVSFDNTDISVASDLTSMDINKRDIAETAFYAMEAINGARRRYYVPAQLMERNSVMQR